LIYDKIKGKNVVPNGIPPLLKETNAAFAGVRIHNRPIASQTFQPLCHATLKYYFYQSGISFRKWCFVIFQNTSVSVSSRPKSRAMSRYSQQSRQSSDEVGVPYLHIAALLL